MAPKWSMIQKIKTIAYSNDRNSIYLKMTKWERILEMNPSSLFFFFFSEKKSDFPRSQSWAMRETRWDLDAHCHSHQPACLSSRLLSSLTSHVESDQGGWVFSVYPPGSVQRRASAHNRRRRGGLEHLSLEPAGAETAALSTKPPEHLSHCRSLLSLIAHKGAAAQTPSLSSLYHMRADKKGAEGCHNSFITLIPLTTHGSIRALEFTSLHKSLMVRITKLACDQKLAEDQRGF